MIGLPGETVQITNGEIYINGQKLDENYCEELIQEPGLAAEGVHLGEDEFFVLGDNRNASVDSRSDEVGIIKRERIKGKAWIRFYPFDQFSRIE